MKGPWIESSGQTGGGETGRTLHPADQMPNYGREVSGVLSDAACLMALNSSFITNEQKEN